MLVDESHSALVRGLHERDPALTMWWATPVECASALARERRAGRLSSQAEAGAIALLRELAQACAEVAPTAAVRGLAERAVRVHALRSADALQLAAALVWCEHSPDGRELVTFDRRLHEAARREGFTVLPEDLGQT
jgi:hypothetical protein